MYDMPMTVDPAGNLDPAAFAPTDPGEPRTRMSIVHRCGRGKNSRILFVALNRMFARAYARHNNRAAISPTRAPAKISCCCADDLQ
jgi:hypothetical protein